MEAIATQADCAVHSLYIAFGSRDELLRIVFERHSPIPDLEDVLDTATDDLTAAERFRTIPRVEVVICGDSQFTIRGQGDDLVTEVIHCLSENRIRVTDFRTILPNLEDVFLKLTGHSIRD